ncbi:MAG: peptidylprolyl isomerase [Muribaculaceae bacterium]|nr:peptidylprolyl isomerase [Muribaculaceae bacterium]
MKVKFFLCAAIACGALLAFAAKDPVLMNVNGKNVTLSEFEYLYKKNSSQQVEKESLDKYVERFVNYKLKVADAEAAGIDTTSAFKNELEGYRYDLVKPFLTDTTVTERLAREAYDRMLKNVDVTHIMIARGATEAQTEEQMVRMDSIRKRILAGENMNELADKFSIDPSVKQNHGDYGYITAGMFPYEFDEVVFTTPKGQLSKPFTTDYGVHMIRANDVKPDDGQVEAAHILISFPRDATPDDKAVAKARIDSIRDLVVNEGQDFATLARNFSQDPSAKRNSGNLGWFGRGRMVKPFEQAAFSMAVGEVSQPIETQFGYHIIKKTGQRPVESYEKLRPQIMQAIQSDARAEAPVRERINQISKQYNVSRNPQLDGYLANVCKNSISCDSALVATLAASKFNAYTFDRGQGAVKLADVAPLLNPKARITKEALPDYLNNRIKTLVDNEVTKYYVNDLINKNADYKNLLNEYRDGSLLYEISNQRVWDAASKDTTGLKNYFEANRSKYIWDKPRFKGLVMMAKNEEVLNEAKQMYMNMHTRDMDFVADSLVRHFNNDIHFERFNNFAPGQNRMVDYLVFDGKIKESLDPRWPEFLLLDGRIINSPETFSDVKGMVTSDYQEVLEKKWIEELHRKYPVVINQSVLKKVKEIQ